MNECIPLSPVSQGQQAFHHRFCVSWQEGGWMSRCRPGGTVVNGIDIDVVMKSPSELFGDRTRHVFQVRVHTWHGRRPYTHRQQTGSYQRQHRSRE